MTITIPIHSFVDLITNSSSEIFVSADANTVKAVKKLIDNILKASGSDKTADDLFEISLLPVQANDLARVENIKSHCPDRARRLVAQLNAAAAALRA